MLLGPIRYRLTDVAMTVDFVPDVRPPAILQVDLDQFDQDIDMRVDFLRGNKIADVRRSPLTPRVVELGDSRVHGTMIIVFRRSGSGHARILTLSRMNLRV